VIFLSFLLSLNGCGIIKKLQNRDGNKEGIEIVVGTAPSMYQITTTYNERQLDSMCLADNIPEAFDGWIGRAYQDYETKEYTLRYMYIKELNDNFEMIYIVTPKGELYVVSKRKVISE
jgi:hypothetical protein